MRFIYGKNSWRTMEQGEENCYLLANGLGGYSSLTVIGSNARNDQALLMASLKAPAERYHLVTNVQERVEMPKESVELASQRYVNRMKNCSGYHQLQCFDLEYIPRWQYKAGGVEINKQIFMKQGENLTALLYEVEADCCGTLVLTPWFQFTRKGELLREGQELILEDGRITSAGITLNYASNGETEPIPAECVRDWYYEQDARDGRDAVGAAMTNHRILCHFKPGKNTFYLIYALKMPQQVNEVWVRAELDREVKRQKALEETAGLKDPAARVLVRSASQYLTWRQSTQGMSMIAGYPFFGDWGRDTMIAMLGCTITAKQFESAKSILRTFMAYCRKGLMPNMFPEKGEEPIYNTVDASLLFLEAVYRYYRACGDEELVQEAWPVMKEIIRWYSRGTDYHIFMDEDGLIYAGEEKWQLTWMDVRIGDILPTPRHGKPVEINAYWYNGLKIMEALAALCGEPEAAGQYGKMADKTKESFLSLFWNEEKGCLRDVISHTGSDEQIRCNQIWALTMSFVMVDRPMAQRILQTVYRHLYTPWGLRTLSPEDGEYHGSYGGSQYQRDLAYHQGTVWPYPLGAYYLAVLRFADSPKEAAGRIQRQLLALEPCLAEGCVGHIAEIYDGDDPHTSRGCYGQAWSVGELLRVYEKLEAGSCQVMQA